MPLDDPSSPGRGVEIDRAIFRVVVGRPGLLDEAARALRTFLFHIELISLNSTDSSSFERTKSRMSFERYLSRFSCGIFCRAHLSQKPSFSREILVVRFSCRPCGKALLRGDQRYAD